MYTSSTRAAQKTLRWIVLLPVLMVGSLLFWSVALGLGGLSLMAASAFSVTARPCFALPEGTDTGDQGATLDVGDGTVPANSILVHLEESVEPEDVNDNAGAAGFTAPTDDQQVTVTPGPGNTSY